MIDQVLTGAVDHGSAEKRFLRRDGTHFWAEVSLMLKRAPSGKPRYVIAVVADISERKQREDEDGRRREYLHAENLRLTRELAESHASLHSHVVRVFDAERKCRQIEQRLHLVANCVPAMIGYWNRELRCEFANDACREWFGLAPEQLVGMTLWELTGAEFENLQPLARMALQGSAQRAVRTLRTLSGGRASIEIRLSPDLDEAAQVRGIFVQMTDVGERQHVHPAG